MAGVITRLLGAFGLAPAAHVERLSRQAEKSAEKAAQLEQRLATARSDAEGWKRRHDESARSAAELKKAAAQAEARAESARAHVERQQARFDDLKTRADALTAQVHQLRDRLQEAQRSANGAREHLMATEMKLDLIEAAIQVLDGRTRREAVAPEAEKAEKLRT